MALRLFFALPLPAPLTCSIATWAEGLRIPPAPENGGGRGGAVRGGGSAARAAVAPRGPVLVPASHLHITLAFLGETPPSALDALERVGAAVTTIPGFQVRLDNLGCWRNGILHLSPRTPIPALAALADTLRSALIAEGFEVERRPFRAHLTLARRAAPTYPPRKHRPDYAFNADRVVLLSSESSPDGIEYVPLREWALAPPDSVNETTGSSAPQLPHQGE